MVGLVDGGLSSHPSQNPMSHQEGAEVRPSIWIMEPG